MEHVTTHGRRLRNAECKHNLMVIANRVINRFLTTNFRHSLTDHPVYDDKLRPAASPLIGGGG